MKTKNYLALALFVLLFYSCQKDNTNQDVITEKSILDLNIPDGFTFSSTDEFTVDITLKAPDGSAIQGTDLSIAYTKSNVVFSSLSDANGKITGKLTLPTFVKDIQLITRYAGLPDTVNVTLINNTISYTYNSANTLKRFTESLNLKSITETLPGGFETIGTWSSAGVPNYLMKKGDAISADFLKDIDASLPEKIHLPISHPQYLSSNAKASITVEKDADVWVTFVHEGASYLNTLGYYTYTVGNAPAKASDIKKKYIVFPNVSYSGSGGGLNSGNKVYLGVFSKNTVIEWFIASNGYQNKTVSQYAPMFYSNNAFNPEVKESNKKHVVVLWDEKRSLALMGFEDVNRENYSDEDFNDAIFYVTSNPIEAIDKNQYQPVDTPKDTDNDGVSDNFDEYPADVTKAKNNYYPTKTTYGTLAYEDLWPAKGDYDMNDMVIDYQFNQITNAANKVVEIKANIILRAIGASYKNGFGIQLPIAANAVSKVTGQRLTKSLIKNLSTGVESNQSKAVVMLFDYNRDLFPTVGGEFVNTVSSAAFAKPDTIKLTISLSNLPLLSDMGTPPFNPFIFINGDRTKEVHLAGFKPTDLADTKVFSTSDDNTNVGLNRYYVSKKNLPWAINIPVSFNYPIEKSPITDAYTYFGAWAESGGKLYTDWYLSKSGYINTSKTYNKK